MQLKGIYNICQEIDIKKRVVKQILLALRQIGLMSPNIEIKQP